MDDFRIDEELYATLKRIRESVRGVFEHLRLRNENGDISGKDRLERVPALAKRNFGNLVSAETHLAVKEAWRLVDFLEGNEEARLSPLAREALRSVELDSQLARLRSSDCWEETAARLRRALGASNADRQIRSLASRHESIPDPGHRAAVAARTLHESRTDASPDCRGGAIRSPHSKARWRWLTGASIALSLVGGLASLSLLRPANDQFDPRTACLPLERTSADALAAHWAIAPRSPVPLPPPDPANPDPIMFTVSDPVGGPVRSIFTTSQFSYEQPLRPSHERGRGAGPRTGTAGPGGGVADGTLRVGGWGDTYLSLLKFPLPNNRPVRRAVLRMVVLGYDPTSRPTTMVLRVIRDPWDVSPGPHNRLWWRHCPRSDAFMRLPAPAAPESGYEINITEIYNLWAQGTIPNQGLMLEPEQIGSYGSSAEHYPNLNAFYSTRAIAREKRPMVILTY